MFVWECLKTEGQHLGMCMDGFMFGSCCVHDTSENIIGDHLTTPKVHEENINHSFGGENIRKENIL